MINKLSQTLLKSNIQSIWLKWVASRVNYRGTTLLRMIALSIAHYQNLKKEKNVLPKCHFIIKICSLIDN